MTEWPAMQTMADAHKVGLGKLAELQAAVETLRAGDREGAVKVLEGMVRFFEQDLRMHFRHEEQGLFPVLSRWVGRAGPIDAMLQEHDSLWRAVDSLGELVAAIGGAAAGDDRATAAMEKVVNHLVWLLTSHIQKEDTMLFPLAERTLDRAGKREVDDNVDTLESMYRSPR